MIGGCGRFNDARPSISDASPSNRWRNYFSSDSASPKCDFDVHYRDVTGSDGRASLDTRVL